MPRTGTQRVLELAAHQPLLHPRVVEARWIARESLLHLYRQGLLVRAARGVYALADAPDQNFLPQFQVQVPDRLGLSTRTPLAINFQLV